MIENCRLRQLSIVVPTINEESTISDVLGRLAPLRKRGAEVIVVDGGSMDATAAKARFHANCVLSAPRGRGSQMNTGAAVARGAL